MKINIGLRLINKKIGIEMKTNKKNIVRHSRRGWELNTCEIDKMINWIIIIMQDDWLKYCISNDNGEWDESLIEW